MGGFFGTISQQACKADLFYGTDYNSHLGTRRAGMATYDPQRGFIRKIHSLESTYFRTKFECELPFFEGNSGIGVISDTDPQPIIFNSHLGKFAIVTVAKIANIDELEKRMLAANHHFAELSSGKINQTELVALLITEGRDFVEGIENVYNSVKGSCSMLLLTENGIIAARDKLGRTPIVIGKKDGAYAASSESTCFPNLDYQIDRYIGPGEIVRITADGVEQLRMCKEVDEVEKIVAAQRIAEQALEEVLNDIKVGVTEKEIAARLTYLMLHYGAENMSFDPIVVSGANSSKPHGVPGEKTIGAGDFVTMDFGCRKNGYCSDMTRTVAVGMPTDEMRSVYQTVLNAQLAGIAAAKAGVTGERVDAAARKVISDAGYGDYFGHSFGHSLGLDIHEHPIAAPGVHARLPEHTVISAEPGIYLPGKFGVRIEDVMHLTADGAEILTRSPKNLIIL